MNKEYKYQVGDLFVVFDRPYNVGTLVAINEKHANAYCIEWSFDQTHGHYKKDKIDLWVKNGTLKHFPVKE
jgi:hypothetical protein